MPEETGEGSIGIEAGTSEVAPESEQEVFAAEMWPEPSEVEGAENTEGIPAETGGNPSAEPAAAEFDVNTVSATADPDSIPEELRPMFTRMQSQFKGLQTTLNDRDAELTQLRNGTSAAATDAAQQQPVTQPQHSPAQEQYDPLNPYPYVDIPQAGPTFSAEDRQQVIHGVHQVNQIIDHRLSNYSQYLDAMPQIVGALVELVGRAQAGDTQLETESKQDLISAYGENAPNVPAVNALVLSGAANPATGEPFTHREAYERVHGITAEQVAELEGKRKNARSTAKRNGAGSPRANTETPAANHMSTEQVNRQMAAAGWTE
jgi:hypothetical protein